MNDLIKPTRLSVLEINIPYDFNASGLKQMLEIDYTFIVAPSDHNVTYLYLEIVLAAESTIGDPFKLDCKIIWCFAIRPIYKATAEMVFECTEFTRNHLSSIIDATYSHQKNKIPVPPISFEEERTYIMEKLNPLLGHN